MNHLNQSFSWWCFAERGIKAKDLLKGAASLGYRGVELIEEDLWPVAIDSGLQIVTVAGHDSIKNGLNQKTNTARIEDELLTMIEKAKKWDIQQLICFSGNRQTSDAGLASSIETLSKVAPNAEQAGIQLCIELLNSKVNHPDYEADSTAWGLKLCEEIPSPAISILYDIYHMQVMEGNLIQTIRDHHRHFSHYHTAGVPGRGPTFSEQEINYPAIYRTIAATGYQGFIGHEFIPVSSPLIDLRLAFEHCCQSLDQDGQPEGDPV